MPSFKPFFLAGVFASSFCLAQASWASITLAPGEVQVTDGYQLSGLQGTSTLNVSEWIRNNFNLLQATYQAVPEAVVTVQTVPRDTGFGVRTTSVVVESPLKSLSVAFEGGALTARGVESQGGLLITTAKSGATNGPGWVSISDLKVDLLTQTIRADIAGGNGLVALNDHALWRYDAASGPLTLSPPAGSAGEGPVTLTSAVTLSGLRWLDLADVPQVFGVALNLNMIGLSMLNAVNAPTRSEGFGSLTLSMSVSAVPEPGAWLLSAVGLLGLAWWGRRRKAS